MKLNEIKSQIQDLDFLGSYRSERDPRIKIKLQALHHLQSGKSLKDVAEIVLYDERTVRTWIQRFVMYDYEGLLEKEGRGRHPRLQPEEEENFKIALDELQDQCRGGRKTAYDIQALLLERFDCNYSISGVYALLDRLNIVWISGRSKNPKNSDEVINVFKETFPEEAQAICNTDKEVEIWWQDESRVGQQGSLTRTWATKGTRPRLVRQNQFISTYIFGAVCPSKDKGCALILPQTNTGTMQLHLEQLSLQVDENCHAIILMDRASWHTTEALNIPENITLMPLPPYSPELNPMEQVWQRLKQYHLSNTCFKDYEDIVQACCDAWNVFCDEDGAIEKLCTRSWAKLK